MRLTVPEPKIKLYKDGFEGHDQLGRAETGAKLSDLVERIDDPLVIALDGAWGSGKSFFLKCWVGAHLKRQGNTTQTVYFDAFQHDFLDDPLIALTAEIFDSRVHAPSPISEKVFTKIREAAPRVGRGLLRAGVAVATAGIVQNADELGDAAAKAIGGDLSDTAAKFWRKEDDKRAAMKSFKDGLTALTLPNEDGVPQRKLAIVIDELDRCRPDYALSLLEIIKHFFNVDGVHFVLGCNMEALASTVRSRYGANYDARRYLKRFINFGLRLQQDFQSSSHQAPIENYFLKTIEQMGLDNNPYFPSLKSYISNMKYEQQFSIRNLHQLLGRLVITTPPDHLDQYDEALVAGLLILETFDPDAICKLRRLEGNMWEVTGVLQLQDPFDGFNHQDGINWVAWAACLGDINDTRFEIAAGSDFTNFENGYDRNRIRRLLEQCVDTFRAH